MKPIEEIHVVAPDFVTWAGYNPAVRCACGSSAARGDAGWIVFDPMPLADSAWKELTDSAPIAAIVLTSGNHQRESLILRERFNAPVHAPYAARPDLEADCWHREGESLHGFQLIALPGAATGESAWCDGRTLVLGDALIHLDALEILPDKYCADPQQLRTSLKKLTVESFHRAAFAHGDPIPSRARESILAFLSTL